MSNRIEMTRQELWELVWSMPLRAMPYARRLLDRCQDAEGIDRIRAARTKHGRYSAASIARRREARQAIREIRALLRSAATTEDEML